MAPVDKVDLELVKLQGQMDSQETNVKRNEKNIGKLYDKIDTVDGKVERLTGRFDTLDNKIDGFAYTLSDKIDTLSGVVVKAQKCLNGHIEDSNKKEIEAAIEKTAMSTKQKIIYSALVLIGGGVASGIISLIVHFVKLGGQ